MRPDDLDLDRSNPRFGGEDVPAGRKGEIRVIERLLANADLLELVESIAANGYLDLEPLFVVEERGRAVVVEGNRRLAAIKLLRDPQLAKTAGVVLPSMPADRRKSLETVHVIKLDARDDARQLIGFKHINGTHKWDSYAKARFAADWYRKEKAKGTTLLDIARSLGDRHDTVQRLVQGILVLDQARSRGLFEPEDRYPGRVFFFSHLYTALTRSEYRVFLGLPERWRDAEPVDDPVPDASLPKLKELLNWLFGSREEDQPPVIASQNPDLRNLGEVLASDAATQKLRAEGDLRSAYEWSGARAKQFGEQLIKALIHAEKAAGLSYTYDRDASLLETAENLAKVASSVLKQMKSSKAGVD